jgi:hypothetical protein
MCVILYAKINGKQILAKNRDRIYKPDIQLVHEIIDGIEIAYIQDKKTGWVEGINENGCGIINSTLDRNDGKRTRKNNYISLKSNKVFNALCESKKKDFINNIITHDKNMNFFEGNTLLVFNNTVYHIENNLENNYIIQEAKNNSVYTNHGINMPKEGYVEGTKGLSSYLRKRIIEKELEKIEKKCETKLYDKISSILNKDYINLDPRFHPYRDKNITIKRLKHINKNQPFVSTTGQLILNITDKELIYYKDINNSKEVKYVNKLPRNYIPKIRVVMKHTKKNTKTKKQFPKKHFKSAFHKFYKNTTMRKI